MKKGKKIYLREIADYKNRELFKKILENNSYLSDVLYSTTLENFMEQQLEHGNLCLGNNFHEYINMYDSYSSFFLRVKDSEKMIKNIDKDYLSSEEIELYNKAWDLLEIRNNEEYGTDYYFELEEEIDKVASELLDLIEKDLHAYENPTDEDVLEEFMFQLIENETYSDLYYYENDNTYNLYEDVRYTKNWN